MKYIKVFGIQRSGTTFLRELFKANFEDVVVYTNEFGWKHGTPKNLKEINSWINSKTKNLRYYEAMRDIASGNYICPCIIIKNPYSWYQSIKKWDREKFKFEKRYRHYNNLYEKYREFCEGGYKETDVFRGGVVVRYEDLIRDTSAVMIKISEYFRVKVINDPLDIPRHVQQSSKFSEARRKFYLSDGVFGLNKDIVDKINEILDWNLMSFYGYERRKK